jgi:hypothetical protein
MARSTFILVAFLLGTIAGPAVADWEQAPSLDSLVGERLDFKLKWGIITAARARLEVLRREDGAIVLRASARTAALIDSIYPVRETVESALSTPGMQVQRYFKSGKEGRGPVGQDEILFDWDLGQAVLTRDGESREPIEVPEGVQDPLSSFWAFRVSGAEDYGPVVLEVTDGKKVVAGEVRVVGRERVTVPAGTFDAVIVEPQIEGVGGIFKKSPDASIRIWLTDDEWRTPLKLRSKVVVGHFTAVLIEMSRDPADGAYEGSIPLADE